MTLPRILMTLPLLLALGCAGGHTFERGVKAYHQGDYANAAATFDWVEQEHVSLTEKNMVRYLMYRGLTAFHMGRMTEAKTFLHSARAKYEQGDARWLKPDEVSEMDGALDRLGP